MATTIGEKIRSLRISKGMTQSQLAGQHITKSMLSQIENGKAQPSMGSLQYLAQQLGMEVSQLLQEDGSAEISKLLKEVEDHAKRKEYIEVIAKVKPLLEEKLPLILDVARLMEYYAEACFHTLNEDGEGAVDKAVEIYDHFGLYVEAAKASYIMYALYFTKSQYGASLDLIRNVWRQYKDKKSSRDVLFELSLYYAEAASLSAIGYYEESRNVLLEAISLSHDEKVYFMTDHFYRLLAGISQLIDDEENFGKYMYKARQFAQFSEDEQSVLMVELAEMECLNWKGQYAEALELIQRYPEMKNGNYRGYWFLQKGISYYGLGRYLEALEALSQVTMPDSAHHPIDKASIHSAGAYIANIYAKQGELDQARKLIEQVYETMKVFPPSPYLSFVKETYHEFCGG
ncbi:transcriptional regulator with XRE-family HTH domain [Paenibacillus anaericanus]|uniref:helix-turn-helix domain-containing protein n=1 Tax=Paenibacillus anaericanus TaxID=170367 RepID=UPI0027899518|nr:helix-turn-helix transcriptional regulator [Paenibacillus anaericanus]MDQ0090718.1 transcriptional regulator with XRE-family HTH domain [Paenibacillus anaericanus]